MKIISNREEIKSLRKLASTINDINGIPANRVKELVDEKITTKAYIMTMLTGQLTIELNEEMVLEFLAITNDLLGESSPIFKACLSLGEALAPTFMKYGKKYNKLVDKYSEPEINAEVKSLQTETVNEREVC